MKENEIRIQLLGPIQVELSAGQEAVFRSDSERALLAYLLIERDQPHRRESLGALFWPDVPEKQARSNLRVALHRMRQVVEQNGQKIVTANNRELRFNIDAELWVDVWAFTETLETVDKHKHQSLKSCSVCLSKLNEAVALYRGPFLQGFMIEDSQAFLEWVVLKQEWLHRQMLETLLTLTDVNIEMGDLEQAEKYARRQLALEPWREKAHRQLMNSQALRGERSAALAQYEVCRKVLEAELGVQPSDATQQLVERIRKGEGYGESVRTESPVGKDTADKGKPQLFWKWGLGAIGVAVLAVLGVFGLRNLQSSSVINEEREGIFWEFEGRDDNEGWLAQNELEPFTTIQGGLHTVSTGGDPHLYFPGGIFIDAETMVFLEIRMKVSAGYGAQVFFSLQGEIDFVEEKSVVFPIVPDDDFHTYTLDMSKVDGWQGVVNRLRLDPTDTVATIEIDYIRIIPTLK